MRSAPGLPLLLAPDMELAIVPPVLDAPRRVHVRDMTWRTDDEALVFFEEISDADTAAALVGCHCLARRSDIDWERAGELVLASSWVGWRVVDERAGDLGSVFSIEDRPVQSLMDVQRPDGSHVLVPLVDEFVVGVDEEASLVRVACPAGLLDL